MRKLIRLPFWFASVALGLAFADPSAAFVVDDAPVQNGKLVVSGQTRQAYQPVSSGRRVALRSGPRGTSPSILSDCHLADCAVKVAASDEQRTPIASDILAATSWKETAATSNDTISAATDFMGPRGKITVGNGRRLFVSGSMPVRLADGWTGGVEVEYGVCIFPAPFRPGDHPGTYYAQRGTITPEWRTLSFSVQFNVTGAPPQEVGFCAQLIGDGEVPIVRGRSNGWAILSR